MVRAWDGSTSVDAWETHLDPTGFNDAVSPNDSPIFVETPPTPLDFQDESAVLVTGGDGLTDFLVVGDTRGRVWRLRPTDGVPEGAASADGLTNILFATETSAGASGTEEPITGTISFFDNSGTPSLIFGTGGLGSASNVGTYSIYVIEALTGSLVRRDVQAAGAKIFSGIIVTQDGSCFVGTSTENRFSTSGTFFGTCLGGTLAKFECATGTAVGAPLTLQGGVRAPMNAYEGVLAVATSRGQIVTQGKPVEPTKTTGSCFGSVCVLSEHWEEVF
jgi:hypothetical protein